MAKFEIEVLEEPVVQLKLKKPEVECLIALLYVNLTNPKNSPLTDLDAELATALGMKVRTLGQTDDLDKLAITYSEFVGR